MTADITKGAADLAIPGSESTTRIVKMGSEKGVAEHFANEAEAQAVADNMKDQTWVDKNCGVCRVSPSPLNSAVSRRRDNVNRLNRRGNILTSCCRPPATISESDTMLDEGGPDSVYDTIDYRTIREADLVPPPAYTVRDVSITADVQELQKDLNDLSTGVLAWTPQLTKSMSSDELFSTLRQVFTGPESDPLYSLLRIKERDGKLRMTSFSSHWIRSVDPALKPLQTFVKKAVQHGIDTVTKLKGLSDEDAKFLKGNVEFFYTAPSKTALTGIDPRGFHTDGGMMQFGAADTPGLIVRASALKSASRVPLAKDAFQLLKANYWDLEAWLKGAPDGPTWHSVFGPEMAEKGRVSMVMSVYMKSQPLP